MNADTWLAAASGPQPGGTYSRVWFKEVLPPEEITFDAEVFLLTRAEATRLKSGEASKQKPEEFTLTGGDAGPVTSGSPQFTSQQSDGTAAAAAAALAAQIIRLSGNTPTEVWTRLGRTLIPKLKSGTNLRLGLEIELSVEAQNAASFKSELRQILEELGLAGQIKVD